MCTTLSRFYDLAVPAILCWVVYNKQPPNLRCLVCGLVTNGVSQLRSGKLGN